MGNRRRKKNGSSKYKGVAWIIRDERWQAAIQYEGRNIHLGHFTSEIEAARAYDAAAKQYFGDFALTNFRS